MKTLTLNDKHDLLRRCEHHASEIKSLIGNTFEPLLDTFTIKVNGSGKSYGQAKLSRDKDGAIFTVKYSRRPVKLEILKDGQSIITILGDKPTDPRLMLQLLNNY